MLGLLNFVHFLLSLWLHNAHDNFSCVCCGIASTSAVCVCVLMTLGCSLCDRGIFESINNPGLKLIKTQFLWDILYLFLTAYRNPILRLGPLNPFFGKIKKYVNKIYSLGYRYFKIRDPPFPFLWNIRRKPPVPIISKTLENLGFSWENPLKNRQFSVGIYLNSRIKAWELWLYIGISFLVLLRTMVTNPVNYHDNHWAC